MALIAMAVYDPPEESRTELLRNCLASVSETIDWHSHRMIVVSNGIHRRSREVIEHFQQMNLDFIEGDTNLGTARAINKAWALRQPGENCCKLDSDIIFHDAGWLDKLEDALRHDPNLGLLCLKRRDCVESPYNPPGQWSHSKLIQLPHKPGERWHYVEKVNHAMGSAQLYRSELLDKIGFLYQMGGVYGLDDSLAAARCEAAGFYSAFYCNVDIEHPDPGGTDYQAWKEKYAGERMDAYFKLRDEYLSGRKSVYHGPDDP